MRLIHFIVCDKVQERPDGGYNLIGVGQAGIDATGFPAKIGLEAFAFLEREPNEKPDHSFQISLIGSDGNAVGQMPPFVFLFKDGELHAKVITRSPSFGIPQPGTFFIQIALDGKAIKPGYRFDAKLVPESFSDKSWSDGTPES